MNNPTFILDGSIKYRNRFDYPGGTLDFFKGILQHFVEIIL